MTLLLPLLRKSLLIAALGIGLATSAGCSAAGRSSSPGVCAADAYEKNDTEETAKALPEMRDDPDSVQSLESLTIHSESDEDWFKIPIRDTGLGGDPVITVSVDSTSLRVSTWFTCANKRRGDVVCSLGTSEDTRLTDGSDGCRGKDLEPGVDDLEAIGVDEGHAVTISTDCPSTSDDDGMLFIRVRRVSSQVCGYDPKVAVR